ncbi:hypothetical protein [Cloacibacterium rupense]|uniref:hypothetical protein n=1 Tax=Cloacibacterium rupense TaxID=517423 RepID=UPI00166E31FB|nr:hypothetical protein [Cloacibacterium rupense]
MNLQENKFFLLENGKRKLKNNYLLSYSFSPGLYDKLCQINLYIDNKYNYELHLFFIEYNLKEFNRTKRGERININLKSKLPYKLRSELNEFFKLDTFLKNDYFNDKNTFGILDRNEKVFEINHKNQNYCLIMTADTLDKNLFKSKNELKFLKLTYRIEKWCNKFRDQLMVDYGWKKNYG